MRQGMMLALVALTLPVAALASSIDPAGFKLQVGPPLTVGNFTGNSRACLLQTTISCSTGNYFNGININGGTAWVLNLVGPAGTILLDITSLTTSTGANCSLNGSNSMGTCNFSGTVTAFGTNHSHLFQDTISGMLTRGANPSVPVGANPWVLTTLTGQLGNGFGDLSVMDVQFCRSEQASVGCGSPGDLGRLRSGHGSATLNTVIPEPSTLGLLGTGLIGLAGIARRKFKR